MNPWQPGVISRSPLGAVGVDAWRQVWCKDRASGGEWEALALHTVLDSVTAPSPAQFCVTGTSPRSTPPSAGRGDSSPARTGAVLGPLCSRSPDLTVGGGAEVLGCSPGGLKTDTCPGQVVKSEIWTRALKWLALVFAVFHGKL